MTTPMRKRVQIRPGASIVVLTRAGNFERTDFATENMRGTSDGLSAPCVTLDDGRDVLVKVQDLTDLTEVPDGG